MRIYVEYAPYTYKTTDYEHHYFDDKELIAYQLTAIVYVVTPITQKNGDKMPDLNSHEKKNTEPYYFDDLLKDAINFLKKTQQYLLGMDIRKKKAISLTLIIMTLSFFLDNTGNNIISLFLRISANSVDNKYSLEYMSHFIVFFMMWFPAIYFISLYWKNKNVKFYLSLAYAVGLLMVTLHGVLSCNS